MIHTVLSAPPLPHDPHMPSSVTVRVSMPNGNVNDHLEPVFAALGLRLQALCMVDKHSVTELHPQPPFGGGISSHYVVQAGLPPTVS